MAQKDQMTFNWKMKQNHKLTLTMFSPDTFQSASKPHKTTTTCIVKPVAGTNPTQPPVGVINPTTTSPSLQMNSPTPQSSNPLDTSKWCFHSEYPPPNTTGNISNSPRKIPPFERMTSAPGDLEKYTLMNGSRLQQNSSPTPSNEQSTIPQIGRDQQRTRTFRTNSNSQYHPYPHTERPRNRRVPSRGVPPPLQQQDSAPSLLQSPPITAVRPLNPPLSRPLSKLASAPNLFKYPATENPNIATMNSTFQRPPLISRNSESALPGITSPNMTRSMVQNAYFQNNSNQINLIPQTNSYVFTRLPPLQNSQTQYNVTHSQSPTDSDQEMADVEQQTSKMSIRNLIE